MTICRILTTAVLLGLLSGCVRQTVLPEYSPRVTTAQNSDGMVTLSWLSRVGYTYTIHIRHAASGPWEPLRNAPVVRGTGKVITITDKRHPRAPLPWYTVRAEKQ